MQSLRGTLPASRLSRRTFSHSSTFATPSRSAPAPSTSPPDAVEPQQEQPDQPLSASAYLAAQAALEEANAQPKKQFVVPDKNAWDYNTGDEPQAKMIRRILEDSYKPLRVKGFVKAIPKPAPFPPQYFATETIVDASSTPPPAADAPPRPLHPWEYEYKAPDSYQPAPGYRTQPLVAPGAAKKKPLVPGGAKGRAGAAAVKKARLASAYERTLDYKVGIRPSHNYEEEEHDASQLGNPTLSAWGGIAEAKIQQAIRQGLLKDVKGRGKPIPRDEAESNPFISREDFLINRVLKQQEVSPPWVETQKDLEIALATFRQSLRASYTRRVLRIRSSEGLTKAVVSEVREGWRDKDWERREEAYHNAALLDLNTLTRKYNVIAPYHVRRQLLTLESELRAAVTVCSPSLAVELQRRLDTGMKDESGRVMWKDDGERSGVRSVTAEDLGGEKKEVKETMWSGFKRLVVEVLAQTPDPVPVKRRA